METEIWKDVVGYEGIYQISSIGRLKRLAGVGCKSERILKSKVGNRGYYCHPLSSKCIVKTFTIHRLMAHAFIPNPENKAEVNHIDGNKTNNNLSNLEWVTKSENQQHAYDIGLKFGYWTGKFGKDHHRAKDIIRISKNGKIKKYQSLIDAAHENKVLSTNICKVLHEKGKSCGGFQWKYK